MVTRQRDLNPPKHKHSQKKPRAGNYVELGTPQVPLRRRQFKQEPEQLSDWESAT